VFGIRYKRPFARSCTPKWHRVLSSVVGCC
jgi:hypothetical protein